MSDPTPDLLAVTLHLRPRRIPEDRALPRWWGRAAHALLLRALAALNPTLAQRLHEPGDAPRPFTVSTLMGPRASGGLDPQATYRLRFTAFQREVAVALQQALQSGGPLAPGATVDLDGVPFEVLPPPEEATPWDGATTYAALAGPWLTARQTPARTWTLRLASPTTFRTGGHHMPFPLPHLVFGSLLQRWNAYAPVALPKETHRFAAEAMAVTRYRLHTRSVPLKAGGLRIGAVGEVTYRALPYDRYWMSVLQSLAAFARFAGIGAGTTMGLGQARWVPPQPSNPAPEPPQEAVPPLGGASLS